MKDTQYFISFYRLKADLLEAGFDVAELEMQSYDQLLKLRETLKFIHINQYDKVKLVVDENLKENEIRIGLHTYGF